MKTNNPIAIAVPLNYFIDNIQKIKSDNLNAISIRDSRPGSNSRLYDIIDSSGINNLYIVLLDDIIKPESGYVMPEQKHIAYILSWAKRKWDENNQKFIIHCTGGVSRSSAISMLINQMLLNNYELGWNVNLHTPNKKILEFGEKILNIEPFSHIVKQKEKEFSEKLFGG